MNTKLILFICVILLISISIAYADHTVYGNLYVQDNIYGDNITARNGYYFIGDGSLLTNVPAGISATLPLVLIGDVLSINKVYINITGDTWQGNMNAGAYSLTNVGSLIMAGLITSKDIIPTTTELYSLGNSTNWWNEAYIKTLHSKDIFTDRLNASEINSTDINSDNVDIEENLTFKNITMKEESGDFIIDLGS